MQPELTAIRELKHATRLQLEQCRESLKGIKAAVKVYNRILTQLEKFEK